MRILFLSPGRGPDYLADMVFHGLRSLLGTDIVDVNRLEYMYRGAEVKHLYGKGFTLYGLIDEGQVDRTDIDSKIKHRYFDYVIFGSIQRDFELLGMVREFYSPSRIIFLDGEDNPLYLVELVSGGHGLYFKREMCNKVPGLFPIEFAIPKEKIQGCGIKTHLMAHLDPLDTRTYVYQDEESYYDGYKSAMFGKTMKKAGWDCLRHYEILACQCLPYFMNIEHCPQMIMTHFPKEECRVINTLLEYKGINIFNGSSGRDLWGDLMLRCEKVLIEKLTTDRLATRILDTAIAEKAA